MRSRTREPSVASSCDSDDFAGHVESELGELNSARQLRASRNRVFGNFEYISSAENTDSEEVRAVSDGALTDAVSNAIVFGRVGRGRGRGRRARNNSFE